MSETAGLKSALIVPCNMCPAVAAAVDDGEPFIQFFRYFLRSAPFERRISELQSQLSQRGVHSAVFRSPLPYQWFLCMCPSARRRKLRSRAAGFDAAIVLGCATAVETVRDAVGSTDCRVIEGMTVTGFINARLKFHLPGAISFDDCKFVPISVEGDARSLEPATHSAPQGLEDVDSGIWSLGCSPNAPARLPTPPQDRACATEPSPGAGGGATPR